MRVGWEWGQKLEERSGSGQVGGVWDTEKRGLIAQRDFIASRDQLGGAREFE